MIQEPVVEEFFRYKGYYCCVIFQPLGFRCGYVMVQNQHPAYEKNYNDLHINCHGGLTFSDHTLIDTKFSGWWIGFDCAHTWDLIDVDSQMKYYGEKIRSSVFDYLNYAVGNDTSKGVVRSKNFCKWQCRNIVNQLEEMR